MIEYDLCVILIYNNINLYIMRVPKLPEGLDREIRLLGGAAPLSSRKTGYLLRVAHMIPIIFPALRGRTRPSAGLHSMALLASLCF